MDSLLPNDSTLGNFYLKEIIAICVCVYLQACPLKNVIYDKNWKGSENIREMEGLLSLKEALWHQRNGCINYRPFRKGNTRQVLQIMLKMNTGINQEVFIIYKIKKEEVFKIICSILFQFG